MHRAKTRGGQAARARWAPAFTRARRGFRKREMHFAVNVAAKSGGPHIYNLHGGPVYA